MAIEPSPRLRILVVDDNASMREPLRAILEEEGFRVTLADGGQAAIEALWDAERKGDHFSVVLTDLEMPEVNSSKVAAAAKRVTPLFPSFFFRAKRSALPQRRQISPKWIASWASLPSCSSCAEH